MIDRNFKTPFSKGRFLFKSNAFKEALDCFKQAMNERDIKCRFGYANMLYFGFSVDGKFIRNKKGGERIMAIIYGPLLDLANNNDAEACFIIGMYFLNGYYSARSKEHALIWFNKATELGYFEAKEMILSSFTVWDNANLYSSIYDDTFYKDKNKLSSLVDDYVSLSNDRNNINDKIDKLNKIESDFLLLYNKLDTYLKMLSAQGYENYIINESQNDFVRLSRLLFLQKEKNMSKLKNVKSENYIENSDIQETFEGLFTDFNSFLNSDYTEVLQSFADEHQSNNLIKPLVRDLYLYPTTYSMLAKKNIINGKIITNGFNSTLEKRLIDLKIDKAIYLTLFNTLIDSRTKLNQFNIYKATFLYPTKEKIILQNKIDVLDIGKKIDYQDLNTDIIPNSGSHLYFQEMFELIQTGMKDFFIDGEQFFDEIFAKKWIFASSGTDIFLLTDINECRIVYKKENSVKNLFSLSLAFAKCYMFTKLNVKKDFYLENLENDIFTLSICYGFAYYILNLLADFKPIPLELINENKNALIVQSILNDAFYTFIEEKCEEKSDYNLLGKELIFNDIAPQAFQKIYDYSLNSESFDIVDLDTKSFNDSPYASLARLFAQIFGTEIYRLFLINNNDSFKNMMMDLVLKSDKSTTKDAFLSLNINICDSEYYQKCYDYLANDILDCIKSCQNYRNKSEG